MVDSRGAGLPLVLVVDPDDQFRRLLAAMLLGVAETVEAADVASTAAAVRAERPDVVLVDPRHLRRGLPSLREVLAAHGTHPRVPVLACTSAHLRPREMDQLGIDAVLPHRLLSRPRLRRHLSRLCPAPRVAEPAPTTAAPPVAAVPCPVTG